MKKVCLDHNVTILQNYRVSQHILLLWSSLLLCYCQELTVFNGKRWVTLWITEASLINVRYVYLCLLSQLCSDKASRFYCNFCVLVWLGLGKSISFHLQVGSTDSQNHVKSFQNGCDSLSWCSGYLTYFYKLKF